MIFVPFNQVAPIKHTHTHKHTHRHSSRNTNFPDKETSGLKEAAFKQVTKIWVRKLPSLPLDSNIPTQREGTPGLSLCIKKGNLSFLRKSSYLLKTVKIYCITDSALNTRRFERVKCRQMIPCIKLLIKLRRTNLIYVVTKHFSSRVPRILNVSTACLVSLWNRTKSCDPMNEIHQLLLTKPKVELISLGD